MRVSILTPPPLHPGAFGSSSPPPPSSAHGNLSSTRLPAGRVQATGLACDRRPTPALLVPVAIFCLWYHRAGCRRVHDNIHGGLKRGARRRLTMDGPRLSRTGHPPSWWCSWPILWTCLSMLLDATAMWANTLTNAPPSIVSRVRSRFIRIPPIYEHLGSGLPSRSLPPPLCVLAAAISGIQLLRRWRLPEQTSHSPLGARVEMETELAAPPRASAVASLLAIQGPWATLPQ